MRATSLLRKLLAIKQITVNGIESECGDLIIDVRPTWRRGRCSKCGRICGGYDTLPVRRWRHLDFGGVRVYLRYAPRRVSCPECGIIEERVAWNEEPISRFTQDFEEQVSFMAQHSDKTTVGQLFRVAWSTVGRIIERVVRRVRPADPLEGLEYIGVDELSYRKGHRYLTLVTDHDSGRIVWAAEGKSSETLQAFFEALGEQGRSRIKMVTMDMSEAYIKAVRKAVPHAQIVFDRFHVQQLVSGALEKTRREEWQRIRSEGDEQEANDIKYMRWILLKNPWNLSSLEWERLNLLPQRNKRLYRAYILKETFAAIMDRLQPNVVKQKLREWIAWARRSRLPAFSRVALTIREHLDDIVAYIRSGLSNGVVEGLNTKARLLTRRAYGFHSAGAVIAMIMLCCTDIVLHPVEKKLCF